MSVLKVANQKILESLPNHKEGEIAFLEDTSEYMVYKGEKWNPINASVENNGLSINLYELNKQAIQQLPPYEDEHWLGAEEILNDWLNKTNNQYYLLYSREIGYFTLFVKCEERGKDKGNIVRRLRYDCLDYLGEVYSINLTEDEQAVEIWINTEMGMTCLMLFGYDAGVVYYE